MSAPTRAATRSWCSVAAATSWSPTPASRGPSSRSAPAASPPTSRTTPSCGGVLVTVAAGEEWDTVVAQAVERGWVGIEALSGIPGAVGATPIQNVGAYGQDVAQTIASVRVWDRRLRGVRTFANADCGFGYRHSRFKADPGRHVVLDVTFQFPQGDLGAPVAYAELARTLGVGVGERVPMADVREAVLGLRRGKGMVLDAADHDTWSAGSFFTNPVVDPAAVPDGAPTWPADDGVKVSAAWLIEHAGFGKGYGVELTDGRAGLSTKHTLALTNRGGGLGRGPVGRGARGPRRRRAGPWHPAGQRARAGRLRALTQAQEPAARIATRATPNTGAPARAGWSPRSPSPCPRWPSRGRRSAGPGRPPCAPGRPPPRRTVPQGSGDRTGTRRPAPPDPARTPSTPAGGPAAPGRRSRTPAAVAAGGRRRRRRRSRGVLLVGRLLGRRRGVLGPGVLRGRTGGGGERVLLGSP